MTLVRPHPFVLAPLLAVASACFSPDNEEAAHAGTTTDDGSTSGPATISTTGASASATGLGTSSGTTEDETSTGSDSGQIESSDSSGSESTGAPPAACDSDGPFTEIRELGELDTPDDEGNQSLTLDELTIYYFSNTQSPGTADLDVYVATRDSIDEAFGAPSPLDQLNSGADDRGGWITADELAFYFYSSRSGSYDLYVSSRGNVAAAFGPPEPLGPNVNTTEAIEQHPYVTPDGSTLYFMRDYFIYRAELGADGFADPLPVSELNEDLGGPMVLTEDGLAIYFASTRPGGAGDWDIWRATREATDAVFEDATNVAELNLDDTDFLEWISPDGCRVYLTSRRAGGAGGWDMWVAERTP